MTKFYFINEDEGVKVDATDLLNHLLSCYRSVHEDSTPERMKDMLLTLDQLSQIATEEFLQDWLGIFD